MIYKIILIFFLLLYIIKKKIIKDKFYKYLGDKEIIKNLWLGNKYTSNNKDFFIKNNIQLVINCTRHLEFIDLDVNKYRLDVHDNLSNRTHSLILKNIDNIIELINKYLKNNKGVLIHCHAGMQRAATVTACYLMSKFKYNPNEVIKKIREKRKIAFRPFPNYYHTLETFYNKI